LARCFARDPGSDLGPDLGFDLGLDPARCPARDPVPGFGCRGRAASRRSSMGCARRSRNSRDGGGGRRRSRPRTPPAPPQAAWAPSTWVAAPLILAPDNARAGVGFAAGGRAPLPLIPAHSASKTRVNALMLQSRGRSPWFWVPAFAPRVPGAVQRVTKWSGAPLIRDRHRLERSPVCSAP